MRNKLSIAEIICVLISALLPLLDGMFAWKVWTRFENISEQEMSLQNLMTVQRIGGGGFLYWIFYITLVVMLVYCVSDIFCEDKFIGKKITIAIPTLSFLFAAIMVISSSNHSDTFVYKGETRYLGVSMNILAYIEIVLLISIVIVECYKQFKCKTE